MKNIRNFCIIAHIDHGKSTLADRLLEFTNTIKVTEGQMLDDMDLEKERGITIKSHAIQMEYEKDGQKYVINLIDTPGHVDFSYEVSRSIAACEGALLVVDATQGVQAQTISNLYMAIDNNLEIIPVINKCDMPNAMPEEVTDEIVDLLGCDPEEIILASGKTGQGVKEILDAVVERIPHPEGDPDAPLQALIFDSVFNSFRGIIAYFKIVNGVVEGAVLEAGGNIVLKRGMQGMDRGELEAGGNIVAKFLENCVVRCKGGLKADAVLHSQVICRESVEVLGKKGLINGGYIKTYGEIHATTLGSTMGSHTKLEILPDIDLIKQTNEWKEEIEDKKAKLEKIEKVATKIKKHVENHEEVSDEQKTYLKNAVVHKPLYLKDIKQMKADREELLERIKRNKNACVYVDSTVFPGVKVSIKDVSRQFQENLSHCRIYREGADVRIGGF